MLLEKSVCYDQCIHYTLFLGTMAITLCCSYNEIYSYAKVMLVVIKLKLPLFIVLVVDT